MSKLIRNKIKPDRKPQLVATLFATLGSFGLGTVLSWSAPTLPQMSAGLSPDLRASLFFPASPGPGLLLSREEQSWVASLLNFGAFTAGPLAGFLMPKYGKKWTMMILSVPIFVGWICLITARNVEMLYCGRFLTGFAGAFSMLAPGFIAEICEVEVRGSLASFMQVMTMLGLLFTYTIGAYLDWRDLSLVSALFPVATVICLATIPRSPVFLVSTGDMAGAGRALQFYRGKSYDVTQEVTDMEKSFLDNKHIDKTGIVDIFSKRNYRKPLLLSAMLMLMQQFSGIKVINSYIVQIFQNAGGKFNANICAIVVGVIQVTGTSLSVLVVDKFGRRRLLIISEFFIFISFCISQDAHPSVAHELAWLPLASIVTFAVAYSMGLGPLPWVMNAELFSAPAKSTSSSLCASFNWLCSFTVVKFSPTLETWIGASGSYLSFALLAFTGTLLIGFLVPETKGKTEEEIQKYFQEDLDRRGHHSKAREEESEIESEPFHVT